MTTASEAIKGLVGAVRDCGSIELHGERICWGCSQRVKACLCEPTARERRDRAASLRKNKGET